MAAFKVCVVTVATLVLAVQTVLGVAVRGDLPADVYTMDLKMRGAKPEKSDEYLCTGYEVPDGDSYIVKFEALADAGTAHHILVFGCDQAASSAPFWNCGQTCTQKSQILFAWAKNAPPLQLPKDVGRHIGRGVKINSIVVQIHYAHKFGPKEKPDESGIRLYLTRQRQRFVAGIYLLLSYQLNIPGNKEKVYGDISCRFGWRNSIFPFGYRTHAHELGKVISGYKIDRDTYEYTMIGKGNPQWPQAFYPVNDIIEIKPGDRVAARCTFDSIGRDRTTVIGGTAKDEMCNFYIMYYMDAKEENNTGEDTCAGNNDPFVIANLPEGNDVTLPPNAALEGAAHGHHHHSAMTGGGGGHEGDEKETPLNPASPPSRDEDIDNDAVEIDSLLSNDVKLRFVSEVAHSPTIKLGQVGGVAIGSNGDLFIYHRGDNTWDAMSFDYQNRYKKNNPVTAAAIVVMDRNGTVKDSFGSNEYYLPHGISIDPSGNLWMTDVARHQVMRIPAGQRTPDLVLGEKFMPGTDAKHFCKPADVVAMTTGVFFVADGYCNSRIMKFDKDGKLLKSWGTSNGPMKADGYPAAGAFNVPHSLTLAEDKGLVCVADRENGRIQCFDLEGNFIREMHPKLFGRKLYAIEYCPNHGGLIFAVNGEGYGAETTVIQGFTLNINDGTLLGTWNVPTGGLQSPHDVTVDSKNHFIYVGELNPSRVLKFAMDLKKSPVQTIQDNIIRVLPPPVHVDSHKPAGDGNMVGDSAGGMMPSNYVHTDDTKEDSTPSIIIGVMLVVPVLLLIAVTVFVRLYQTGHLSYCKRRRGKAKFNLGSLLNSHKGFDRLSTEESDHELEDAMDDSDQEEFNITMNSKA